MDEEMKEAFNNAYMELGGLGERVLGKDCLKETCKLMKYSDLCPVHYPALVNCCWRLIINVKKK